MCLLGALKLQTFQSRKAAGTPKLHKPSLHINMAPNMCPLHGKVVSVGFLGGRGLHVSSGEGKYVAKDPEQRDATAAVAEFFEKAIVGFT